MIIQDIETLFRIDKQQVIIQLDDNTKRIVDFYGLTKNNNLNPYELELVIGSKVIANTILDEKEISIEKIEEENEHKFKTLTLEEGFNKELAIANNSSKILEFYEIIEIKKIVYHEEKETFLIKLVNHPECFIREKSLKAWTGLETKYFDAIVGLKCSPKFFCSGEIMSDFYGSANYCTRDNTIVKNLNLRFEQNELEYIRTNISKINLDIN